MKKIKEFPELDGNNPWFALSKYKDLKFDSVSNIKGTYDYIIVGAGFGGVSAALRLAEHEPLASIALFDALPIGAFSSGRNAGFISQTQLTKALVGFHKYTLEDHRILSKLNSQVVQRIEQIKEQKHLDFEWRHDGSYRAVREKHNFESLKELSRLYKKLGADVEDLNEEQLFERLGTKFYKSGIYVKDTILDNPSEVVRGLASALPKNVSVFENTRVTAITKGTRPKVQIENSFEITAKKIILTVNAFVRNFKGSNTSRVAAIHSFGALTRQLTDKEFEPYKHIKPWGLTATHPSGATIRFTPNRRIFVRTDISFATQLNLKEERIENSKYLLRRAFERRFPDLEAVNFEYHYGGLISFTGNAQPLFGEIAQNIFAGTTSDGSGVARAFILGTYLADLITGHDSKELNYLKEKYHPSYLPPEPFRTIGADIALYFKNRNAGVEL
ncbi:MAG: FAD-binding oxidoreductase [Succinivibrio sp.]|nr:FAD-binding oxidoreductase [Succinivibrio sp.]